MFWNKAVGLHGIENQCLKTGLSYPNRECGSPIFIEVIIASK